MTERPTKPTEVIYHRLPAAELIRRLPELMKHFGSPTGSNDPLVVMLCRDRTYVDGYQTKPSIQHTLVTCEVCGDDAWIGPKQLQVRPALRLCMICVSILSVHAVDGGPKEVRSLNPDIDNVPRRTS
jgi:hypothetical protein